MCPVINRTTRGRGLIIEYKTACGGTIVVPSKAQEHLRVHPEVHGLLQEAVGRLALPEDGRFLAVAVEMGRVVGKSGCAETPCVGPDDPAFFALRVGRDKPSRVTLGVQGPDMTKVVVLAFASRESARTYVLVTSFVGELAPKEPWDRNIRSQGEFQKSLDFWSSHALVHDPAVMAEPFQSTWNQVLGR